MLYHHERSMQEHPPAAKAHDNANLFTLLLLITMYPAAAAEGLAFHKWTAVNTLMCVAAKLLAFLAKSLSMMLLSAIQGYHFLNDKLFLFSFGCGIHQLTLPDSTESTVSAMRMVVGRWDTRRIVLSFCA